MKKLLVINSGSSSIKYQLFGSPCNRVIASGSVERIGETDGVHRQRTHENGDVTEERSSHFISDHREGLSMIEASLRKSGSLTSLAELHGIGHRVVHGGDLFREPTLVDQNVLAKISEMNPLAPLHNPPNLMGIDVAMQLAPDVPQVAVFDTAFHQSIPAFACRYALPEDLYTKHRVRRYGFHGTSHGFVARQAAEYLCKPIETLKLITLHLGNGASAAAIADGHSVDTSMGMTPLEGLIMGTRCGDIDPAIPFYLERAGFSNDDIETLLNTDSGLKGICGENDMREVHRLADAGNEKAQLALDMYCYRIRKYIGAYSAVLGGLDALIFTGGIGENDARVREQCCQGLELLGITIDAERNAGTIAGSVDISAGGSAVAVLVVPTNEELEIARQTLNCIRDSAS